MHVEYTKRTKTTFFYKDGLPEPVDQPSKVLIKIIGSEKECEKAIKKIKKVLN